MPEDVSGGFVEGIENNAGGTFERVFSGILSGILLEIPFEKTQDFFFEIPGIPLETPSKISPETFTGIPLRTGTLLTIFKATPETIPGETGGILEENPRGIGEGSSKEI